MRRSAMPKPERQTDPFLDYPDQVEDKVSTRPKGDCECGDIIPPRGAESTCWAVTHHARHLAFLGPRGRAAPEWKTLVAAQKAAIDQYEAQFRWYRQQLNERTDELNVVTRLSEDQWARIEELEAELDGIARFGHT